MRFKRLQILQLTGLPSRTLNHWIKTGIIPRPIREGREVFYDEATLERIRKLQKLSFLDMSIRLRLIDEGKASQIFGNQVATFKYIDGILSVTYRRYHDYQE